MERIAFIIGQRYLYWSTILMVLGAAVAICLFLSFYLKKSGNVNAAALAVPVAMVFSLVLSRLIHWYCRENAYGSFLSAMTDYTSGGYALLGVFAGCFLTAVLLRALKISRNLPEMLDCMCLGGGAGIGVGRLASFFDSSDRGQIVESVKTLPWVYPVTNSVSQVEEYRLAVFMIQAMVVWTIVLMLAVWYTSASKHKNFRNGDATLIFLMCYGASQVVLDSARYDSLYFRSNGFVSIVQVMSALAIGLALVVFSVRMVKERGFHWKKLLLWLIIAALIGVAGYMEYHVQRHGDQAVFAYTVMSSCLMVVIIMALHIRSLGKKRPRYIRAR